MKLNMLVVTDHSTHAETNSMYSLSRALREDPRCREIWVCSRGLDLNKEFFNGNALADIYASPVDEEFGFESAPRYFRESALKIQRSDIDVILIRMPQPPDPAFLFSLESIVPPYRIINNPAGIMETATKAFLLEVSHLCPEPVFCERLEEAIDLSQKKEIVLKPLYSYGGRGILRLSTEYCWNGNDRHVLSELPSIVTQAQFPMMAFSFMKNVTMGDKRTIVVNEKVLGSALRLPAPGSWMCNVAQGGHAVLAEADEDELIIERQLTPMLFRKGIIMYGFDTLVNDEGRRVLSEINTMSIGGLVPLQEMSGKPIMKEAAELVWDYIEQRNN